jgi:hypothetical protein
MELVIIVAVYCCAELLIAMLPPGGRFVLLARASVAVAALGTIVVYLGYAKEKYDREEHVRQERIERARYIDSHLMRHPP